MAGFGKKFKVTVSNMQIFREDVDEVPAGTNVGVNLKGVKKGVLTKGMLLIAAGSLEPTNHFEVICRLTLLTNFVVTEQP